LQINIHNLNSYKMVFLDIFEKGVAYTSNELKRKGRVLILLIVYIVKHNYFKLKSIIILLNKKVSNKCNS